MKVIDYSPKGTNVAQDAYIAVTFDKEINFSTVNADTFVVTEISSNRVSGSYSISDDLKTIYFYPSGLLTYGETYLVFIAGENEPDEDFAGIRSLDNDCLTNDFVFYFTIGSLLSEEESTPPASGIAHQLEIENIYPQDYAIVDELYKVEVLSSGILLPSGIRIQFSETINSDSLEDKIQWLGMHSFYYNYISGSLYLDVDENVLYIRNHPSGFFFTYGYTYEITISEGIESDKENVIPLAESYIIHYIPKFPYLYVNLDILKYGFGHLFNYTDYELLLMYMRTWYQVKEMFKDYMFTAEQLKRLVECLTRYHLIRDKLAINADDAFGIDIQKTLGDFSVTRRLATRISGTLGIIIDGIYDCILNEMAGLKLNITTTVPRGGDQRFPKKLRTKFFYDFEDN